MLAYDRPEFAGQRISLYVTDRAAARSIVWMLGIGVCFALFVLALI
jgi:uncharacterized MAPEG superfamily protein